jgi:hypothetical protein
MRLISRKLSALVAALLISASIGRAAIAPSATDGIRSALRQPNKGLRVIALVRAVDAVSEAAFPGMVSSLQSDIMGHRYNDDLMLVLLPRWTVHSPAVALETILKVKDLGRRVGMVRQAVQLWAKQDPAALRGYAQSIRHRQNRSLVERQVAVALAESDPEAGLSFARRLPSADLVSVHSEIFSNWARTDPVAAAARVVKLSRGRGKELAVHEVAYHWRALDPQATLVWLNGLPANERILKARGDAFETWCRVDLDGARAFLKELGATTSTLGYTELVGKQLAELDSQAAGDWIRSLTNRGRQAAAASGAIKALVQTAPATAAEFVLLVRDTYSSDYLYMIGSKWAAQDLPAATGWARGIKDGRARGRALTGVFENVMERDYPQATKFIASEPDQLARITLSRTLAAKWGQDDPQRMLKWVAATGDEPLRHTLLTLAVGVIARADPKEAARVADQFLGGQLPTTAADTILRHWVPTDPEAAVKWAINKPQSVISATAYHSIIATFPLDRAAEIVSLIAGIRNAETQRSAVTAWADRLSESEPLAALKWIHHSSQRNAIENRFYSVMNRALKKDRHAALKIAADYPAGKARDDFIRRFISNLADLDPQLALDWIADQEVDQYTDNAVRQQVVTRWSVKDPAVATRVAMKFKSADARDQSVRSAFNYWIRADFEAALKFVENLDDDGLRGVLMTPLVTKVADRRPAEAVRMAMTLQDAARLNALRATFDTWRKNDRNAALSWLRQLKDVPLKLNLIGGLHYSLSREVPEQVAAMARELPSGSVRRSALQASLQNWAKKDVTEAMKFIRTIDSVSERKAASVSVMHEVVRSALPEIGAMLSGEPDHDLRREMLRAIVGSWISKAPGPAVDWMMMNLTVQEREGFVDTFRYGAGEGRHEAMARFMKDLSERRQLEMVRSLTTS